MLRAGVLLFRNRFVVCSRVTERERGHRGSLGFLLNLRRLGVLVLNGDGGVIDLNGVDFRHTAS